MILLSMARRLWLWAPPVAYLLLIFYLSGRPHIAWAGRYPDYLLHAAEYCVLAILLARALNQGLSRPLPRGRLALAWMLCVLYATTDEIHQAFVPGRFADYRDVLSDAAGAALGLAGLMLLQRLVGLTAARPGDPRRRAVLYGRPGCAPCFAMRRAAGRAARRRGLELIVIDVDSDPGLLRLHGHQVPVLELPGGQMLRGSVSAEEIDNAFLEAARSAPPAPAGAGDPKPRHGVARTVERIRRHLKARA